MALAGVDTPTGSKGNGFCSFHVQRKGQRLIGIVVSLQIIRIVFLTVHGYNEVSRRAFLRERERYGVRSLFALKHCGVYRIHGCESSFLAVLVNRHREQTSIRRFKCVVIHLHAARKPRISG